MVSETPNSTPKQWWLCIYIHIYVHWPQYATKAILINSKHSEQDFSFNLVFFGNDILASDSELSWIVH